MTEQDILNLIEGDVWMMGTLKRAKDLKLPDWMIGAGFVRNKIWDHLHGYSNDQVQTQDIDCIYFDSVRIDQDFDKKLSEKLTKETDVKWEIVNQAYTHSWHARESYRNTEEALADWVETPTCIAVSIQEDGSLQLHAPLGIEDLVNLTVRRNPNCSDSKSYENRITSKKWQEKWPLLKIYKD